MKMRVRKLLSVILCAGMCVSMTACGLGGKDKWVSEAAAQVDSDVRSGEFMLDGEVYTFPMSVQDMLDKGWHVSNNYENKDEFVLEPGWESTGV